MKRSLIESPELTSDGSRLLFQREAEGRLAIWQLEIGRGSLNRLTFVDGNQWNPVVSPSDDRVVYGHYVLNDAARAPTTLTVKSLASNTTGAEPLLDWPVNTRSMDWSSDGRFVIFATRSFPSFLRDGAASPDEPPPIEELRSFRSSWDIWALPMDDSGEPFPVVDSDFNEWNAQLSPKMDWIAFESDEQGTIEVYLQSFPDGDVKLKVSTNGGAQPRWNSDGSELYFLGLDRMLHVVSMPEGLAIELAGLPPPEPLFVMDVADVAPRDYAFLPHYLVDDEGRILISEVKPVSDPLTVILNWSGEPVGQQ